MKRFTGIDEEGNTCDVVSDNFNEARRILNKGGFYIYRITLITKGA
jgi:hypothetical protein